MSTAKPEFKEQSNQNVLLVSKPKFEWITKEEYSKLITDFNLEWYKFNDLEFVPPYEFLANKIYSDVKKSSETGYNIRLVKIDNKLRQIDFCPYERFITHDFCENQIEFLDNIGLRVNVSRNPPIVDFETSIIVYYTEDGIKQMFDELKPEFNVIKYSTTFIKTESESRIIILKNNSEIAQYDGFICKTNFLNFYAKFH